MSADGSIVIEARIDDKKAQQELNRLNRKIQTLNDQIYVKQQQKMPLVEQARQLGAELDVAKAKLNEMQSAPKGSFTVETIKEQQETVRALQADWARVQSKVESYDAGIKKASIELDLAKERAGEIHQQLAAANPATQAMSQAMDRMQKSAGKFSMRLREVIRSALIFTVISQGLASLREWMNKVIKTNDEARASIARLKGALLTLAQPLINVIIPAFTDLLNVLTSIITSAARFVSILFGTTIEESAQAAENLYNEANAIEGVGESAKKASKSLASFDEINKLSGENNSAGNTDQGIQPNFNQNWLSGIVNQVSAWIPTALILGGIALIAIGAAMASLILVIAGLGILGYGISMAAGNEALQSWVDSLGLNSVEEFIVSAVLLGGIAVVAIGAAMANIFMVIAGLALIGTTVLYAEQSGAIQDWANTLGLARAAQYVTAGLIIGGIALIAIGAALTNILMVIAGLGLLAAGIYVGVQSGTLRAWAEALGLENVFDYVVAAMQLAGMAMIAIGAATANLALVIAGGVILGLGIAADALGQKALMPWWETLQLTTVQQWVSIALLLVGVALIAIGAMMVNVLMVLAGAALIGFGTIVATQGADLESWVTVLGLEEVVGWVTAALMLAGMGFIVFGIVTANVLMVIAGIGLLAAGFVVGATTGTFESWVETLGLEEVAGWVSTAMLLGGIALVAIGAMTANPLLVIAGLGLLGAGAITKLGSAKTGNMSGAAYSAGYTRNINMPQIPQLATGAVIPPNRAFMAVLGDQKSGNNIEAPEGLIRRIVREETANSSTGMNNIVIEVDGQTFGRLVYKYNGKESGRIGGSLVEG